MYCSNINCKRTVYPGFFLVVLVLVIQALSPSPPPHFSILLQTSNNNHMVQPEVIKMSGINVLPLSFHHCLDRDHRA